MIFVVETEPDRPPASPSATATVPVPPTTQKYPSTLFGGGSCRTYDE